MRSLGAETNRCAAVETQNRRTSGFVRRNADPEIGRLWQICTWNSLEASVALRRETKLVNHTWTQGLGVVGAAVVVIDSIVVGIARNVRTCERLKRRIPGGTERYGQPVIL